MERYVLLTREAMRGTNATMSSAILTANFPTLVPPNFWTSHLAEGSMVFWWRLGGVTGNDDGDDDDDDNGLVRSDISGGWPR